MDKIYIFVELSLKPNQRIEFMSQLMEHTKRVRMEQGCDVLEILLSHDSEDRIYVWEIWRNRGHWDVHMSNLTSKKWQLVASKFVIHKSITILQNPGK